MYSFLTGSGNSGHYIALVKDANEDPKFNIIDDNNINPKSRQSSKQPNSGDGPLSADQLKHSECKFSRASYVLFYE